MYVKKNNRRSTRSLKPNYPKDIPVSSLHHSQFSSCRVKQKKKSFLTPCYSINEASQLSLCRLPSTLQLHFAEGLPSLTCGSRRPLSSSGDSTSNAHTSVFLLLHVRLYWRQAAPSILRRARLLNCASPHSPRQTSDALMMAPREKKSPATAPSIPRVFAENEHPRGKRQLPIWRNANCLFGGTPIANLEERRVLETPASDSSPTVLQTAWLHCTLELRSQQVRTHACDAFGAGWCA